MSERPQPLELGRAQPPVSAPRKAAQPQGADEQMTPLVKAAEQKVGRNDPCWCGSGKKFKLCHGAA